MYVYFILSLIISIVSIYNGLLWTGVFGVVGSTLCVLAGGGAKGSLEVGSVGQRIAGMAAGVAMALVGMAMLQYSGFWIRLGSLRLDGWEWGAIGLVTGFMFTTKKLAIEANQPKPEARQRLSNADLRNRDLRGKDLSGADLTGADLSGADLTGANLAGADMRRTAENQRRATKLNRANLTGANLTGTNLWGADLVGTIMTDTCLLGADLRRTNMSNANFNGVSLTGLDLFGSLADGVDFSGANLAHANLASMNLSHANLAGADLSFAKLSGDDLTSANLQSTNLANADLTGARRRPDITTILSGYTPVTRFDLIGAVGLESVKGLLD